jgi:hypothetical protein
LWVTESLWKKDVGRIRKGASAGRTWIRPYNRGRFSNSFQGTTGADLEKIPQMTYLNIPPPAGTSGKGFLYTMRMGEEKQTPVTDDTQSPAPK